MKTGLLWYDPDPKKPARAKIDEAAARYRERCGAAPNTCHVHPDELTSHPVLHVVANRWLRPCTFWVGEDEQLAASAASGTPARAGRRGSTPAQRSA